MRTLGLSAIAAAFIATSASALTPGVAPDTMNPTGMVVHVKKDPPPKGKPGPDEPKPKYKPGHSYKEPPPGWKRHAKRPPGYLKRGCVSVGPVWFCP
jgi:hypothetical protein